MKRYLFLVMMLLIPFIQGCKKDNETDPNMQIRGIAWNYLDAQAKATVNVDWEKAPVTITTFNGSSAYAVAFNTTEDALLGPIIVYIDTTTKVVLGEALRM